MKTPSISLVHVLIGKSVIETLLVGTLAVVAFMNVLPPYFRGWGDVNEPGISGWAVNNAAPWSRVEIQIFVDGKFMAQGVADQSRADVLAAGWSKDEWHGYTFPIRGLTVGAHEARIYALHQSEAGERKTLQQLGAPLHFSVAPDGTLVKVAVSK